MAEQITNYKCPACSGPLEFDAKSGQMKCTYCDSLFSVEEIEAKYAEANAKAEAAKKEADNNKSDDWQVTGEYLGAEGMKSYTCPSCSATLVCDDNMAASSCPYCGNPTIVPGQFADMLKPDFVLPFKKDKNEAVDALKKHYGKKYLLPKMFRDNSHLEKVSGVYVPFWLYDGKADGYCTYEGQKIETRRQGDEEIITTRYYDVAREGKLEFKKIPADASTKMDDNIMDSIEPYDYVDLKPFTKAYLTGYLADKYDVSAKDDAKRAVERAKQSTKDALRNDAQGDYTSLSDRRSDINVKQGKVYYAMMPVWMLTTNWNGKSYTFAMNGQTGKMVGDLPVDKPKLWFTEIVLLLVLFGLGFGALHWNIWGAIIFAAVVALIVYMLLTRSLKSVAKARTANNYIDENSVKITLRKDDFVRQTVEKRKLNTGNNK